MNNATLIGNLVRDPELRATQAGVPVCVFTIAVNRRSKTEGTQEADYFRVTTWRGLAENCAKYLLKGSKVGVVGAVSLNTYDGRDGKTHASIEINATEVELLTPRSERSDADDSGLTFTPVGPDSDLPF